MFDQRNEGRDVQEGASLREKGFEVTQQIARTVSRVSIKESVSRVNIKDSIKESSSASDSPAGFNQSRFKRSAVQISETEFELKHIKDSRQDIVIKMRDDVEGSRIEWENMPIVLNQAIEQDYELVKNYPLMCINMALAGLTEEVEGLRPFEEIS